LVGIMLLRVLIILLMVLTTLLRVRIMRIRVGIMRIRALKMRSRYRQVRIEDEVVIDRRRAVPLLLRWNRDRQVSLEQLSHSNEKQNAAVLRTAGRKSCRHCAVLLGAVGYCCILWGTVGGTLGYCAARLHTVRCCGVTRLKLLL
jgi:hypothetical protein